MWYSQLVRGRFVYDTSHTMKATRSRHGWVHMFITHRPSLTLQLHNFDLFRTSRTSSFCTVAWQLARFQLTRRIARSLGDSWASCRDRASYLSKVADLTHPAWISLRSLVWKNYSPSAIVWFCLCDSVFSRFSRTPTCDRHRRTQGHKIFRASIASCGKNNFQLSLLCEVFAIVSSFKCLDTLYV